MLADTTSRTKSTSVALNSIGLAIRSEDFSYGVITVNTAWSSCASRDLRKIQSSAHLSLNHFCRRRLRAVCCSLDCLWTIAIHENSCDIHRERRHDSRGLSATLAIVHDNVCKNCSVALGSVALLRLFSVCDIDSGARTDDNIIVAHGNSFWGFPRLDPVNKKPAHLNCGQSVIIDQEKESSTFQYYYPVCFY